MSNCNIPELTYLLSEVERKYNRRIATTNDFESLSVVIEHYTGELLSASTLKRLWGYVNLNPTPRLSTLDILSRFVGYANFKAFCENLKKSNIYASTFFTSKYLDVSALDKGQLVTIGWGPDRLVKLEYIGDFTFEVRSSANSQLQTGDRMELSNVIIGYPLVISRIFRNGEYTSPYIAGKQGGINMINIE